MQTISIAMMAQAVSHVAIAQNDPCMFWGPPGAGKTQGVEQAARDMDADLIDIRVGQYDSVDLRGFPGVDKETGQTVWHAPSTLPFVGNPNFDPERKKLLFLDEINGGTLPVQGVCYQLVQEGRVGEHVLQPNTFIVAAGNRESDRGATNRMALPLANRFTHFAVEPDADTWCQWAVTQPHIPSEGVAFLQFRKVLISTFDPSKPDKAFATPRSWEKAFAYFRSTMPEDLKVAAMQGAIGEGPAAEFWGFVDVIKDMPSIKQIEKDPTGTPVPETPAVRYAVAVGISGALDLKNTRPLDTFLRRMDPEFGVLAWQLALKRDRTLSGTPQFIDMAKDFRAIFAR